MYLSLSIHISIYLSLSIYIYVYIHITYLMYHILFRGQGYRAESIISIASRPVGGVRPSNVGGASAVGDPLINHFVVRLF